MRSLFKFAADAFRWLAIFVVTASLFSMMIAPSFTLGVIGVSALAAFTLSESKNGRQNPANRFRTCRNCSARI